MAKSILQEDTKHCFLCGTTRMLETHHVFGAACRDSSEHYGLKVRLCRQCHNEPPKGVHQDKEIRQALQAHAQLVAMRHYSWTVDDFRKIFHKSYVWEEPQ